MANTPGVASSRQSLLGSASQMVAVFNTLGQQLTAQQSQVNAQIKTTIDSINNVASNLADINAKTIGVTARTQDALGAMTSIATATDSYLDLNGNDAPDTGEYMVYSSGSYDIVDKVVQGIEEFTANVTYDMNMEANDPDEAIVTVDPIAYYNIPALNTVSFTLTLEPTPAAAASMFSDTVYVVPTTLYGDGSVVLAEWDLIFVITYSP